MILALGVKGLIYVLITVGKCMPNEVNSYVSAVSTTVKNTLCYPSLPQIKIGTLAYV
jgi:hypothetical protein